MNSREWQRSIAGQTYLVSTSRNLPYDFVQKVFSDPTVFWAKPISPEQMTTMLDNSCTLGMYEASRDNRTPIGMARLITDYVTFAYLADVYVLEAYRGRGLGKWLIECCRDVVLTIPALRQMMLLTGSEQAKQLYRRELGMGVFGVEDEVVAMATRQSKLQAMFSTDQ